MGCSAKRLSSTRSGTVSSRLLIAAMACLPLPAPIPPLALLSREKRVARLGHGRGKDVLAADIDALARHAAEPLVKPCGLLPGQLPYAVNAEKVEVAQYGRAD